MTEDQWIKQLTQEGFQDISISRNEPNTEFPEHTHEQTTVHVTLEGEITLIDSKGSQVLHTGDRFEIPAGTTHHAKCGPDGCTFIVGVKK